jgi:hypothetical protein
VDFEDCAKNLVQLCAKTLCNLVEKQTTGFLELYCTKNAVKRCATHRETPWEKPLKTQRYVFLYE